MSLEKIGRYHILKRLGGGGFGEVFLGRDDHIDRDVAIKVFRPKDENLIAFATSSTEEGLELLRARFIQEARILAKLERSRHVINVLDFGELDDGAPYYVMPYLPKSLADEIGKDVFDTGALTELPKEKHPKALPLDVALKLLQQIIQGIADAHKQGLVHRDIKPDNILFDEDGGIQVVDFGIAKAPDGQQSTVSHLGMGSRNYMAPEQRESAKHVDARADIYSIGVLAYRMLTGRLPVGRFSDPNVYQAGLGQQANDLIINIMAELKDDRPASDASELLALFNAALKNDAATNAGDGNATSATMVEGPSAKLRDEVVPLKNRIKVLLLQHGILAKQHQEELAALAAIADVDSNGLSELIKQVTQENKAKIIPKKNYLKHVDEKLAASNGILGDDSIITLTRAGEAAGWSNSEASDLLKQRMAKYKAKPASANTKAQTKPKIAPAKKSTSSPKSQQAKPKPAKKRGLTVFLILLLGAGVASAVVYQNYQEQERQAVVAAKAEQQRKAKEQLAEKERLAEEKAEQQRQIEEQLAAQARIEQEQAAKAKAERQRFMSEKVAKAEKAPLAKQQAAEAALEKLAGKLVKIPSGSFQMGSNESADEKPIHRVNISSFTMQEHEVTWAQYQQCIDAGACPNNDSDGGDNGWGKGNRPVINVSWNDIMQKYIPWLNKQTGKRFRLPSESEWEYAARAGSTTKYSWGNSASTIKANYSDSGKRKTVAVKSYAPNAFGLYDMHGNVLEWVQDCYHDSYSGAPSNGSARSSCNTHYYVLRGGSFNSYAVRLRSASRFYNTVGKRGRNIGFRLVQDR
jgi:formylglycine-generating enzyme required for sulfatase activity